MTHVAASVTAAARNQSAGSYAGSNPAVRLEQTMSEWSQYLRQLADAQPKAQVAQNVRQAASAIDRMVADVASYRRKDAAHEKLIGQLYELLQADNLDDAYELVRAEYFAIHGPNE